MAENFTFETWAEENYLKRKTCTLLREQDLDTLPALQLAQPGDIVSLELTAGQKRLVLAAIAKLTVPLPGIEPVTEDTSHEDSGAAAPREVPDVSGLLDAGKSYDQLMKMDSADNNVSAKTHFDPRIILTTKASGNKVIHITAFLNEKTKRRRSSRRKELVLSTRSESDNIVIKTEDDHPYSGLWIEEWGAANSRLLNHLLVTDRLARTDIEYYLAYTTQIFEFATKYTWESVLDFDYTYRELQAEHNMVWGVFSTHLEMHLLVPKYVPSGYVTRQAQRSSGDQNVDCRMFKATGSCTFGTKCRYRHVRVFKTGTQAQPFNQSKNGGL
jgi:hypothetical protein